MKETIQTLRNVLLRTFVISLAFALLTATVYYTGRTCWDRMIVDRWQLIDQPSLNLLVVGFFTLFASTSFLSSSRQSSPCTGPLGGLSDL